MHSTVTTYLFVLAAPVMVAWLAMRVMRVGSVNPRHHGGTETIWLDAQSAFDSARRRHIRRRLVMSLTGRRRAWALPVLRQPYGIHGLRSLGRYEVPLAEIVGSVDGGRHTFDRHFDLAEDDAWARFRSVFTARSDGADLPPVLLYRAADGYYVLDGHHRVAVARALGDTVISAEVTLLCD